MNDFIQRVLAFLDPNKAQPLRYEEFLDEIDVMVEEANDRLAQLEQEGNAAANKIAALQTALYRIDEESDKIAGLIVSLEAAKPKASN